MKAHTLYECLFEETRDDKAVTWKWQNSKQSEQVVKSNKIINHMLMIIASFVTMNWNKVQETFVEEDLT